MSNSTIKLLENVIDYAALKHKVISRNIANIETKNYKRETVDFRQVFNDNLQPRLEVKNDKHFSSPNDLNKFKVTIDSSKENFSGINNVNIDEEMAELAENTLLFKFAAKKIGDYYKNIQNIIRGGRGG